jgi:CheY-like chemotaxis protein
VHADSTSINQVLMNICLNARDAMPEGGKLTLETENVVLDEDYVRTRVEARRGEFVRLRVSDTGQGIAPEVMSRIFEPFFTTKEIGKGTGLGLAMVFGIVKQHRGWVDCSSAVKEGSCFEIYLPRAGTEVVSSSPGMRSPPRGGEETILLVDDKSMIRDIGRHILKGYGYQVIVAEDGNQAEDIFRSKKERIHLVVLDLNMPQLSGRDTLQRLLTIDPDVRVLFTSGYSAEDVPPTDEKNVLGFIAKPFRAQDFARIIREVLDKKASR